MGKPTGFMEYKREVSVAEDPKKRIQHFNEFHEHLPKEKQRLQGARCMECGVPFCQSGMMICGMGQRMTPCTIWCRSGTTGIYRQLAAGLQPPEEDQQFPRVHFQSMPCLV